MPLLLPLAAALVGFAAAAAFFAIFSETRHVSLAASGGLTVAVVAGFLVPWGEDRVPFLGFGAVEAGSHRLAALPQSLAAVQAATVLGGLAAVAAGGVAALVPGCVVRFVCCGSEQGWWLAWGFHGLVGAAAATGSAALLLWVAG